MINFFESFLPKQWEKNANHIKTYQHSISVANAAKIIAANTDFLNPNRAFLYGLMHDIGKFFLEKSEKYKHPTFGYNLMLEKYPDIANICITHPFPNLNLEQYFYHYCKNDCAESKKIKNILIDIKPNPYIELIQLCDKLSGINEYTTIENKFNWYKENYKIDEYSFKANFNKLMQIKTTFDKLIKKDIYIILNINS